MESSYLGIVFSSMWIVNCFCATDFRNITEPEPTYIGHHRNPHEPKIIWLYSDHPNLPIETHKTDNQGYYTNSRPSVAFTDVESSVKVAKPMKLVAPQILYNFQGPPIEAPPNVERRLSQQISPNPRLVQNHNHQSYKKGPQVISSETIVHPVHTRNFVQHNIQHPLYNIQPQYYIPKKYGLLNGKLVYDPTSLQLVQRPVLPTFYHSTQQFPHFQQLGQHQQMVNQHQQLPRPVASTRLPPITKSQFKAPPRSEFQPIDTPSEQPEQQEEPTREEKPVSEDKEEEVSEDNANYEEDDDEAEHYEAPEFEKYFHDDEDDHENIENSDDDEEEDDSDRGSTSFVPYSRKFPKKYYFKPEKKSEIKYGHKNEHAKLRSSMQKPKKKQKMQYESYRYSKDSAKYPEAIEGLQSKQIPVTHKQKILKEKWYLTKSSDNEQFD